MSTPPRGWASQEKLDRVNTQFSTVSPVAKYKNALDVIDRSTVYLVGTDTAEANSTASVINATSHAAKKGDRIRFTSGSHTGTEVEVLSVDTNTITLIFDLDSAPSTDDFDILRPISLTVGAAGGLTGISSVNTFVLDGSNQQVTEDTVTPANNRPLPVKLTGIDGDVIINSSNLNLAVQLDHDSANPDSVQIGDGTETVAVNASNEMQVRDDDANTALSSISADTSNLDVALSTVATEATLSTLNAKFVSGTDIGDVTINNSTGASAVNIQDGGNSITIDNTNLDAALSTLATESTLSSVDGKLTSFDLDTGAGTEDNLGVNLRFAASGGSVQAGTATDPLRIDPTGSTTQPISAASLPLPTGAATEATLSTIDADTSTIAGAVSGSEMQVDIVSGAVDVNWLDVVDFLDTPLLDASSSNIPASASAPLSVVSSLAANVSKVQVADTTGGFIGVYSDPAGTPVLEFVIGPGSDQTIEVDLPAATEIGVRNMENSALTTGMLIMNFMG